MVNNEIVLLLHAYLFTLKNLKHIMAHRIYRAKTYKDYSIFTKILNNCIKFNDVNVLGY